MKKQIICKNCKHRIVKKYSVKNGESIVEWKHLSGGTYCKTPDEVRSYVACLCNNAEPQAPTGDNAP